MKRASPGSACSAKVTTPGTGGRAKKMKMSAEAVQCKKVENALGEADIPAGALEALLGIMPHSLLVPKDERHEFQERALDMVADILEKIKAQKEQAIPMKEKECEDAKQAKAAAEIELEKAKEECDSTQKASLESKGSLAEVAGTFQSAKKALAEIQAKLVQSNQDALEATSKKDIVEGLLTEIAGFQNRAAEMLEVKEFMQKVTSQLEEVDSSMMSALSLALAKAADARGQFDEMVIKELGEKCTRRVNELTEVVKAGEPAKAALTAEVAAAEAALQEARAAQIASAKAYTKAAETAAAAEQANKDAKKALAESGRVARKAAQDADNASALKDIFNEGPMQDFETLRARLAPEVPAPAEESKPEEELAAADEIMLEPAAMMPEPVAVAVA